MPVINKENPINWGHPLNYKRYAWYKCLPGDNYARMRELTGRYALQGVNIPPRNAGSLGGQGLWGSRYYDTNAILTSSRTMPEIGKANTSFSVAMWIYVATSSTRFSGVYIGSAGGYSLRLTAAVGSFSGVYMTNGSLAYGAALGLPAYTWARFLGVRDCANSQMRLYWNGVDVTSVQSNVGFTSDYSGSYNLEIGYTGSGNIDSLNGNIDDVSIWNGRVMTASDAWMDYDLSRRGYPGVLNRLSNKVYFTSPSVTGNWHYYQQQYALMGAA